MQLADYSLKRMPITDVEIDSPYLKARVYALCPSDAVYDVIIGNVPGARPANDHDREWIKTHAVTTKARARRGTQVSPLKHATAKKRSTKERSPGCKKRPFPDKI